MNHLLEAARPPLRALDDALVAIRAGAAARDADPLPPFPDEPFAALERAGALAFNAVGGARRPPAAQELGLVREVAGADGSVGRIFDGHLNAVERLAVQAREPLRDRELSAVRAGELLAGVWGGDPVDDEGEPARVLTIDGAEVLRGVKTFCSGAGGLQRALILAREGSPGEAAGPPVSAWVDLTDDRRVEIDESWYRSRGLRASVSHRVVFHNAPVLARLGPPGAISAQPWFGRDGLRTAASWAGMIDCAAAAALAELAQRPTRGPLESLAAGRVLAGRHTVSAWIDAAARAMDGAGPDLPAVSLHARVAIADAARSLLDQAARACGSRPFVRGGALDRSRRDLDVFLLQHRLEPMLARSGDAALTAQAGDPA